MIYLDNAATTATRKEVVSAMMPYFDGVFANASSLHTAGQKAREAVEEARAKIAKLLNVQPEEIYFTSGGSESDNWAIMSSATLGEMRRKKHIITTPIEHEAVLNVVKKLEKRGFKISYLKVDQYGLVDPKEVESLITNETCLVSVMYANNEIGTIEPINEIGKICKAKGVVFHTDAVQAVGHIPLETQNVDLLSASAHKFGGPKGIGFLMAKRGKIPFNFIEGGAQERGKRPGTENTPAIVGTAKALEMAYAEMDSEIKRQTALRDKLIAELAAIPHSALNGHPTKRVPGNVSFCFEGIEGESLLLLLDQKGICASSGSACTSGSLDPSHVLLAIGRIHDVAHGSLRLSFNYQTTNQEIEKTIEATKEVVEYLRKISPVWQELEKGERKHVI